MKPNGIGEIFLSSNPYLTFLQRFVRNPKYVGSMIPSSSFLARKMVAPIQWNHIQSIAELGAGTGAITRYIKPRVTKSTNVLLFEMDAKMRRILQLEFPDFDCHANALNLTGILDQKGIGQLDCMISGLPFFNFSPELRNLLLDQITRSLKPGGLFIAFQYSLQMKKALSDAFEIANIDFTPFNLPPAFVYVCRKRMNSIM